MTQAPDAGGGRSIDQVIEIDAPIEAVWKALTEARELERWFPLTARSSPGVGGAIWLSWGAPWEGDARIEIWEPMRHLRTSWPFHAPRPADGSPVIPLAVDYFLESRDGRTVLRLVHSGFGSAASWDDEFDGTRRGWRFELRSLQHYLEHHRGQDRRVAWALHHVPGTVEDIWRRLTGSAGLFAASSISGLVPGDRYALDLASGEALSGQVILNHPPTDFSATIVPWNDALWRIGIEGAGINRDIWWWVNLYGSACAQAPAIEARWSALLARLFPEGRRGDRHRSADG